MLFQNQCLSIVLPDGGKTKFKVERTDDTRVISLDVSWPPNSQLAQGGLLMVWDRNLQGAYSIFQGCKTAVLELPPLRLESEDLRRIGDRVEYRVSGQLPHWVGGYSENIGPNSHNTSFEIFNDTDPRIVIRCHIGYPDRLAQAETKLIEMLESISVFDPDQWE